MAYKQSQGVEENQLVLRAVNNNIKSLSLLALFAESGNPPKKQDSDSKFALPAFNRDRLYFTPTFLHPADQHYYRLNETYERIQFARKVQENLYFLIRMKPEQKHQKINFAMPHSNFCQICQLKYENYFQHTTEPAHQQKIKNNAINKSIEELCFSLKNDKSKGSTKPIRKGRKNQSHPTYRRPETRSVKLMSQESNRSLNLSTRIESE